MGKIVFYTALISAIVSVIGYEVIKAAFRRKRKSPRTVADIIDTHEHEDAARKQVAKMRDDRKNYTMEEKASETTKRLERFKNDS